MQAGWTGMFAVERDISAFLTLQHNLASTNKAFKFDWPTWLPQEAHSVGDFLESYRDRLRTLVGSVDMVVGGPPCQGFSSAGRRNPNDPRNKLVEYYLDFVSILKPKIVLIENVKGITLDFDDAKSLDGKINYSHWIVTALSSNYTVFSKLLDTSNFGVPQRRNRFFIVAIRKDLKNHWDDDPFNCLERDRLSFLKYKGIIAVPVPSKSAISDLEIGKNGKIPSRDTNGFQDISYVNPVTSYQKIMAMNAGQIPSDTRLARHNERIVSRFEKLIGICHANGRLNISLSAELKASLGLKKCAIRVLDPDSPAPTITSMPDDLIHYSEPRTLTVRENARLQSFPDWFAFRGPYTSGGHRRKKEVPRFTQVANAVPPLIAEAIGLTLINELRPAILLADVKYYEDPQTNSEIPVTHS